MRILPLCVECADEPAPQPAIAVRLERDVAAATERANVVNAAFEVLMIS